MFTCSTLLLFPYQVLADIHGCVQHVTLWNVPVDVLLRLFLWFGQAKHIECYFIYPPQEVQCMHMCSVAWNVLVICTNHYLTESGWELGRGGGGAVWGKLGGELCVGAVSQHCGESDAGEVCTWEELCGGSCVGEAVGRAVFHSCL